MLFFRCSLVSSITNIFFARLFERGANAVGLDFLSHPFWDKYIEFEERHEREDKIFAILERVVHIPMHQYARYFDRFRTLAQTRPLAELLPEDTLSQFRQEVLAEPPPAVQAGQQQMKVERGELEIEREIRSRIDNFHLEIFSRTQTETTKRWTYESEIKRPYFHVTELDEPQLVNWRKYLDFEEVESGFERVSFLYERCLVTCALYDEFWYRYARWMYAQSGKEEEVRNIYQRASMVFVPIRYLPRVAIPNYVELTSSAVGPESVFSTPISRKHKLARIWHEPYTSQFSRCVSYASP